MSINVLRTRPVTPLDALNQLLSAGFVRGYVDEKVLARAPLSDATEIDNDFRPLGQPGELIPWKKVPTHDADFVGMCATFMKDRTILHAGPIAIQWNDEEGKPCYAVWLFWCGECEVNVYRRDRGWRGCVRFPFPRK